MDGERGLAELARKQWGVFSREQAQEAGLSVWAIHRRLELGAWVEVQRRVYRFAGGHDSWHQSVRAATLSLGPTALASHVTAGLLWRLDGLGMGAPAKIEITVPCTTRLSVCAATLHTTRNVPRRGVRDQIPVTPLARTLFDLASSIDEGAVELALDSAIRKYSATMIGVEQELRSVSPRCRGRSVLSELAALRGRVHTDSPLEAESFQAIRLAGIPLPKTQFTIRRPNGDFVARVDLAWPQHRVVVFVDSREWHMNAKAFEHDLAQRNALEALGWRVLHVTKKMLRSKTWLDALLAVLEAQRAVLRLEL